MARDEASTGHLAVHALEGEPREGRGLPARLAAGPAGNVKSNGLRSDAARTAKGNGGRRRLRATSASCESRDARTPPTGPAPKSLRAGRPRALLASGVPAAHGIDDDHLALATGSSP